MLSLDRGNEPARWRGTAAVLDAADERETRNQVVFREMNEHIAALTSRRNAAGVNLLICECGDRECAEALEITPGEYERVRAHGARFFVHDGHQLPELERVVERNDRFLVVEKIGAAGMIARASSHAANDRALSQFKCQGCGYGASCPSPPDRCPMCGNDLWDDAHARTRERFLPDPGHPLSEGARP